jgi:hypothetical protein
VLPTLEAILEGRRALSVADLSVETPFAFHDLNQPPAGGK